MINQAEKHAIVVYAVGLVYLSLCAPVTATREAIEAAANAQAPTGIASRWQIADEATFADGRPCPVCVMPTPRDNTGFSPANHDDAQEPINTLARRPADDAHRRAVCGFGSEEVQL